MDQQKAENLWLSEGRKAFLGKNDPNSASGLEDNMEEYLKFKTKVEADHIFKKVDFKAKTVLDLGCGPGRFTFLMAKYAQSVIGIDLSSDFIKIAKVYKENHKIQNVTFSVSSISSFIQSTDISYDIIFIGGVLLYLDNVELLKVISGLRRMCNSDSLVVIREPLSCTGENLISDSDIKRIPEEYIRLFSENGFCLTYKKETFLHCPFYKSYKTLKPSVRKKYIIKCTYRLLFSLSAVVNPFFLYLGDWYKSRVSKNWKSKQYFLVFKPEI